MKPIWQVGNDGVKESAAKCDVVCSNCHRERTWGIKNNPIMGINHNRVSLTPRSGVFIVIKRDLEPFKKLYPHIMTRKGFTPTI